MSDIRTAWKDFSGDLALLTTRMRGTVAPVFDLNWADNWDAALAKFTALGGTCVRAGATATRVNAQGLIEVVAANTLRRDYDPVTLACKGLLVEEARTNLLQQSGSIGTAPWNIAGTTTVTPNALAAPDGTVTASTINETAVNGQFFVNYAAGVNGTTYTFSVFAKRGSRNWLRLEGGAGGGGAWFDLLNGVLGTVNSTSASITPYGNGWYRCTITRPMDATLAFYVFAQTQNAEVGYNGTGGLTAVYVWGAQVEQASSATSYIPTAAAVVNRNSDVDDATAIGGFYNAAEGTLIAEARLGTWGGANQWVTQLDDGTGNERISIVRTAQIGVERSIFNGGVGQVFIGNDGAADNTIERYAFAYRLNDFATSANGGAISSANVGRLPVGVNRLHLGQAGGAGLLNGHLRRVAYFPRRLSNAQLQALSVQGAVLTLSEETDVAIVDGLDEDDGLATAVVLSLFTDRRAQPGDALPQGAQLGGTPDRRGWWGDSFAPVPGDKIGSRRWLLFREKLTQSVVARLADYDREALQWLIDDGIARAVNVTTERQGNERIAELIEIVRSDKPVVQYRFDSFWKAV